MTSALFPLPHYRVRALFDHMIIAAPALRLLTDGRGDRGRGCGGGRSVNYVNFRPERMPR
jgi:hypothetical protein